MSGMPTHSKYKVGYFLPPFPCYDWVAKDHIEAAPAWCSVDLRDGNQSLTIPMDLEEKLEFFNALVAIGFREIEIGFPAASETEYEFCRALIERDLIPEDVTIQVLTQAREHIIERTFQAVQGCKTPVIVHVYNSVSAAQREQVFRTGKEEVKQIAVEGAKLLKKLTEEGGHDNIRFEYSPESFTGTEPEYAAEVCNAVLAVWQPTPERKAIINLPVTVEMSSPHVFAQQVEFIHKTLDRRDSVILSLHPHNDRGTGVACAELGLLAGAERIEGTLFGNGERTGNTDIVTLALNMFQHGVDPCLDFSDIPALIDMYERVTRMEVEPRRPYSGSLVFAAFSGGHQDAIAKGLEWRAEHQPEFWTTPYLPIDPTDLGRHYENDVIRINSQSGKGGVGFVLEHKFGYVLPKRLRADLSRVCKSVSVHGHKELMPEELNRIFQDEYVNRQDKIALVDFHFTRKDDNKSFKAFVTVTVNGQELDAVGNGNGRLDAVGNALDKLGFPSRVVEYHENALTAGTDSHAAAYIGIEDGRSIVWGVGEHADIITASVMGLVCAINRK